MRRILIIMCSKHSQESKPNFPFKEDLLQYIWRFKKFNLHSLMTVDNKPIQIIDGGKLNVDEGPDFLDAKIKIGNKTWLGHIEIHKSASEWIAHTHSKNQAYNNVILHVVYHADKRILYPTGEPIPCLELKDRINQEMIDKYQHMMFNSDWIPCQKLISTVNEFLIKLWIERLTIERLEKKTIRISEALSASNNNWDLVCYMEMAKYFGQNINSIPFKNIMNNTPLDILLKHRNQLPQIEALLFGQAGLLNNPVDSYCTALSLEYSFLKKKYKLQNINAVEWKFSKLRPSSFPTVRLAQLAKLIHKQGRIFSQIIQSVDIKEIYNLLDISASAYWDTHYRLDVASKKMVKKIGKSTIEVIIINVIVPTLFAYGKIKKEEKYIDRAINILQILKSEKNKIIRNWNSLGINSKSAAHSQGLIELKQNYCDKFKCLQCTIGNRIMNKQQV